MNWKDYYKLPLHDNNLWVVTNSKDSMPMKAWDWIDNTIMTDMLKEHIVRLINGQTDYLPSFEWSVNPDKSCIICANNKPVIRVRGWGRLTGIGGYNLSIDDAVNVQNDFIKYIINKLTGKE